MRGALSRGHLKVPMTHAPSAAQATCRWAPTPSILWRRGVAAHDIRVTHNNNNHY